MELLLKKGTTILRFVVDGSFLYSITFESRTIYASNMFNHDFT